MSVRSVWKYLVDNVLHHALKFGLVGLIGFAIDVTIFNVLRSAAPGSDSFFYGPIGAKIVSVTVSTIVTWFGNRLWTFRSTRRHNFVLELVEFATIAVLGMGISLACLWISHYVLGYTSLLADNISANVIGLGLATSFRFLLYRYWVYGAHRSDSRSKVQDSRDSIPAA